MKKNPPTRKLREHPDLDQLRRQAKELLALFLAGEADSIAEVNEHYRNADASGFALHDAQLVLARAYGFDGWSKLKAYVDGVTVKRFADAVRAGDEAQVRAMLKVRPELANMEMAKNDEHLAIHYAVFDRNPVMVRLLMQHGADARKGIYPHRDATAARTVALERGYDEIVSIIAEEEQRRREAMSGPGAVVTNSQDELSEAIRKGNDARAFALLEADYIRINAFDREGCTPLHVAAESLNERVVTWLLEHGADVNRRGKDDRAPLDLAVVGVGRRKEGTVEEFVSIAGILRRHGAEPTDRSAVALGEEDWLRARQAEGALTNQIDWSEGGLLTVAVKHNRPEILQLLLDFGFDPDERTRLDEVEEVVSSQGFPLWQCAASGDFEMAEILLKRGANPNVHVCASGSAVYSAYSHRQWEMVKLLQRYGGTLGADTVALYRETEMARQMLANEANGPLPEGMVGPGKTMAEEFLEFSASGGDPEIVRMALERVNWQRDDPWWFWILSSPLCFWNHIPWLYAGNPDFDRSTYFECFRLVLERCGANVCGRFGNTILHEVASMGNWITDEEQLPFAKLLLDEGARMDTRDDLLKSTPLGWACRWGRPAMVNLLLERGADPLETDAEPWATPHAWATKMQCGSVIAVLQQYIEDC